jgi:predicted DNA-binding ribbon-helix-helix protein
MWDALAEVCERENMTIHELVTAINRARQESSLTAAIRVHLLMYYRNIAMGGAALGSASGGRRPGRPRDGVPMRRATR